MFERYTEKARRVIFSARYEAVQFGSPYIETEHLLLGFFREDRHLGKSFFPASVLESIRKSIEENSIPFKKNLASVSVDLPLSNESKRVLKYAADEADRLGHRHIGTEHLLLGLLREEKSFAAKLIREHGVTLESLRERFTSDADLRSRSSFVYPQGFRAPSAQQVEIHGATCNADYIRDRVKLCCEFNWHWQKQEWKERDIAIHRHTGGVSFDANLAGSSEEHDFVQGRWEKDYCAICLWELFESSDDAAHGVGVTNGRNWVCTECYEKFISNPGFFRPITQR